MDAMVPMSEKADGTPALPGGEPNLEVIMTNTGSQWEYTQFIGERTVDGKWPDDGIYVIRVTGTRGEITQEVDLTLEIMGHILNRIIVRTYS